jgi:hypothetical protein
VIETRTNGETSWEIVRDGAALEPGRYLGVLREIPRDRHSVGDWFELVVVDTEGELRWRLVAVEHARTISIFSEKRRTRAARSAQPSSPPRLHA